MSYRQLAKLRVPLPEASTWINVHHFPNKIHFMDPPARIKGLEQLPAGDIFVSEMTCLGKIITAGVSEAVSDPANRMVMYVSDDNFEDASQKDPVNFWRTAIDDVLGAMPREFDVSNNV